MNIVLHLFGWIESPFNPFFKYFVTSLPTTYPTKCLLHRTRASSMNQGEISEPNLNKKTVEP